MNPIGLLLRMTALGLIVVAAMALFQDRLLYFPARASAAEMASAGLGAWPSAAGWRGLVAEPIGPVRGTAVVFHGNAGHAGHRSYYIDPLTRLGLRVVLAEYPGYGPRDGEPGEAALVDDATQTLALAHRMHGAPLLVVGESLGAGVAAAATARQPAIVAALLLITPWDRLEHVAATHYPWLPVKWLLRDRYDSAAHLAGFERPVVVVVAERDTIVAPELGRALHGGLVAPRRLVEIGGAGHNDWIERVDQRWWREITDFLLAAPQAR